VAPSLKMASMQSESKSVLKHDPTINDMSSNMISELECLEFDPTTLGLPKEFLLYSYNKLKGWGCKIPRVELLALLEGIGSGIGMDSSIIQSKKYPDYYLVSTTDFFYPLVEDPFIQGKIAAANVLSDMYAMVQYILLL
jgi:selenide,water dikinase